jgi:hypothetical protein
MKRIVHLAAIAALACGVQTASGEQTSMDAAPVANESAEAYLNVAQVAAPAERYEASRETSAASGARNILHELGFGGGDGFPTRGAPVDD